MTIRYLTTIFLMIILFASSAGANEQLFSKLFEDAHTAKIDLGSYSSYFDDNNLFEFANQALWYESGKKILYIGTQYHGKPWVFLMFDYATNNWTEHQMPNDKYDAHTYDNITLDQKNGIMYWFTKKGELFGFDINSQKWEVISQKGDIPGTKFGMALEYFPEINSLVLIVGGHVALFSLVNNEWSILAKGLKMGVFHNLAEYNSIDKVVVFGGGDYWNGGANDPDHHLYVLKQDKKIKSISNAPVGVSINQGILICDQGSGKYLYRNENSLYRFGTYDSKWELVEHGEYRSPHKSVGLSFGSSGIIAFMYKNNNDVTAYNVSRIPTGKLVDKLTDRALPEKPEITKGRIDRNKAITKKIEGKPVISVGPERYLKTTYEASLIAKNKDIIEIDAGEYINDIAVWRANNLTIKGIGHKVHFISNKKISRNGKAIMVVKGSDITIDNIEFSGAKVSDKNGAGIRLEGKNAVIKNCRFHNNENGILGGGGDVVIEHSEFYNNGLGEKGKTHSLYISKGESLTLRYSYFHDVQNGHHVKTRAKNNFILYNRITDEIKSRSSYLVDIPAGGQSYVIGNVLQQNQDSLNWTMLSYSAEKSKNKEQALYVSGNTFVNNRNNGKFIEVKSNSDGVIVNNLFIGAGKVKLNGLKEVSNIFGESSKILEVEDYNYQLYRSSKAVDGGVDVPAVDGISLQPNFEYIHPLKYQKRVISGEIDVGAFEYRP